MPLRLKILAPRSTAQLKKGPYIIHNEVQPDGTKQIAVWPEVLSSATKAALGWICKHVMHFRGSAALWGPPPELGPVLPFKPVCHLHTIFWLIPPLSPPFLPLLSVVHCNLAQYWPRLWLMPCCSDPGTWTGTDTPGDMSPEEGETDRQRHFCSAAGSQLFITSASSQRLQTDIKLGSGRTSVGVGRGWSLQMRGGVRWWIKAARGRRGRRQHAGVGGGRLGRNRLGRGMRGREKIRFKTETEEEKEMWLQCAHRPEAHRRLVLSFTTRRRWSCAVKGGAKPATAAKCSTFKSLYSAFCTSMKT